jgi:hypothetical protein
MKVNFIAKIVRVDMIQYVHDFLAYGWKFFLRHLVQNGSGAQPASYPMGAGGSFLGGKTSVA